MCVFLWKCLSVCVLCVRVLLYVCSCVFVLLCVSLVYVCVRLSANFFCIGVLVGVRVHVCISP